jgi:hypothetical protein
MVQLTSAEEAAAAIEQLNGQQVIGEAPQQNAAVGAALSGGTQRVAPGGGGSSALLVKYAGDGVTPSDNLYISGLPGTITQEALMSLFQGLGLMVQRSRIIPDTRGTGRGAAMVQVGSLEEAASAIVQLNGQIVEGAEGGAAAAQAVPPQTLSSAPTGQIVRAPTPATPGILQVRYAGATQSPSDNLYITGLPGVSVDNASLESMFTAQGFQVMRCKCIADTRGVGSCAAMVQLASAEQAAAAIEMMNGQSVQQGE